MTKQILSILTAVLLFCGMSVPTVSAEETADGTYGTYRDFSYYVWADGTVQIDKYNGNAIHVIVPAEIEGMPVQSIHMNAFRGNKTLETIELPETLGSIGDSAFRNCTNLKEIYLPDSISYMGIRVFKGCTALTFMRFSKKIKYISDETFLDCTGLVHVQLPSKLRFIGRNVFRNCTSLKEITLPKKLERIDGRAFNNTPNLTIKVHKQNKYFKMQKGVLFSKDGKRLIVYTKNARKNYVVPKSVKVIYRGAFMNSAIQKVTLQKGVKAKTSAFYGCHALKEVRINKGTKEIEHSAFCDCVNLKKVIVKDKKVKMRFSRIGTVEVPPGEDWWKESVRVKIYGYKGSTAQAYVKNENAFRSPKLSGRDDIPKLKFIAL